MHVFRYLIVFSFCVWTQVSAKVFNKCELGRLLKNKYGIPRAEIADWLCLVQSESSYNTRATNRNKNGSTDYGLFQINNGFWCAEGRAGKDCSVNCKDLLSDDITKAVACAKIIKKRHNFNAWYGWKNKCRGKNLSNYIAGCGI